jgi:hypothetical protein
LLTKAADLRLKREEKTGFQNSDFRFQIAGSSAISHPARL